MITDSITPPVQEDWKKEFEEVKAHLDALIKGHKPFLALQYIMTSYFGLLGRYNEGHRMAEQGYIEKVLTKLAELRNKIETDFDSYQNNSGDNTPPTTAAAKDAVEQFKKIEKLLRDNENTSSNPNGIFSSDFVTNVLNEFFNPTSGMEKGTIFQSNTDPSKWSSADYDKLAKTWHDLWAGGDSNKPNSATTIDGKNNIDPSHSPDVQSVTNALTAVSTDFSSQSSIAQSKEKYYETWDEQILSMTHSMMSSFVDQEKSPNTSMRSAGS